LRPEHIRIGYEGLLSREQPGEVDVSAVLASKAVVTHDRPARG
jgi:hypothetical protein